MGVQRLFVLTAFILFSSLCFSTDISSCTNITSPGTYVLTQNIAGAPYGPFWYPQSNSAPACMVITSNDVTLDCNGHSITNSGSGIGIAADNGGNNATIQNCDISRYLIGILPRASTTGVTLVNNTIHGNGFGTYAVNSNLAIYLDHYFNNTKDVESDIYSTGTSHPARMFGVIFDNDLGNYQNFSNITGYLAIDANQNPYSGFTYDWAPNPPSLPENRAAFGGFVNASGGSAYRSLAGTVFNLTFKWTDAGLGAYNESKFELWRYNGTSWALVNNSPDTVNNRLTKSGWAYGTDDGIYGILAPLPPCPDGMLGSGTLGDPCQISNWTNLQAMGRNLNSSYILMNDLNSSTAGYSLYQAPGPGFDPVEIFRGTFDGQNHIITGLYINRTTKNSVGLFGYASGVTILNVGLVNTNIIGNGNLGGLIAQMSNCVINNSYVTGNVTGTGYYVGGLAGFSELSNISNVFFIGNVNGGALCAGGLIGWDYGSITINNSYVIGNVTGTGNYVGGIVGSMSSPTANTTINNSYTFAKVTGNSYVGGFVGDLGAYTAVNTISNSYAIGKITGISNVGGLVGFNSWNRGIITNSYWDICRTGQNTCGDGVLSGCTPMNSISIPNDNYFYNLANWPMALWSYNPSWSSQCNISNVPYGLPVLSGISGQSCQMGPVCTGCSDGMLGSGTREDPCQIKNWTNLQAMNQSPTLSYILMNDLNSSTAGYSLYQAPGLGFTPIGSSIRFSGTFYGNNHNITGLYINLSSQENVGLFGLVDSGASIWDVGLIDVNITSSRDHLGGLAGYIRSSNISNSYATGNVTGTGSYVGGLAGYYDSGSNINTSHFSGNVKGAHYVGGLAGYDNSNNISNSYATGNVTSIVSTGYPIGYHVGGLVGYMNYVKANSISNCSFSGNVNGSVYVGGLIGENYLTTISNSNSSGTVSGDYQVGGLVGHGSNSIISYSNSSGNVTGLQMVGGLVGYYTGDIISNSNFAGNANGTSYIGGLIGQCYYSIISNSSSSGNVSGSSYVGGLSGEYRNSDLQNSYSTGNVSGLSEYVGGLFGSSDGSNINNSHSAGKIVGQNYVGGLLGNIRYNVMINNSYSISDVTGISFVGGLVGNKEAGTGNQIKNSFAAGRVAGSSYTGGLVGNSTSFDIYNSYWDVCRTGQKACTGTPYSDSGCQPVNYRSGRNADYFYNYGNGPISIWGFPPYSDSCDGAGYPSLTIEIGGCRTLAEPSECNLDPFGTLEISSPGNLDLPQNDFSSITLEYKCIRGDCGNVNASLDPLAVSGNVYSMTYSPYFDSASLYNRGSNSLSGKYLAWNGGCSIITGNYPSCWNSGYGCIWNSPSGMAVGDSFEVWDTLQECQDSFGPILFNWVNVSIIPSGVNQTVFCVANATEAALSVNFTVIDSNGNSMFSDDQGTNEGGLWVSQNFTAQAMGKWYCRAVAIESDGKTQTINSSFYPGRKGIVPMGSGNPFYTIDSNPMNLSDLSCLEDMHAGDSCGVTWRINATGMENTVWEFFGIANSSSAYVPSVVSSHFNVTIIGVHYTYYRDSDGDGYGNASDTIRAASQTPPEGYVTDNTDCDDSRKKVHPGAPEICDGLDNDCNPETPDGVDEQLYRIATTCGLGDCINSGRWECQNGQMNDTCVPLLPVSQELCDANIPPHDENCDGTANEGCECVVGQTRPCYTGPEGTEGVGICHNGTQACDIYGKWGECAGVVYPTEEICNGLDDNCNGQPDEGLGTTTCGLGVCNHTLGNCIDGQVQECDPMQGATLETCNGKDDDCDGQVDQVRRGDSMVSVCPTPAEKPLQISFRSSCDANTVTVTAGGNEIADARVTIGDSIYRTASDGTVSFSGCGKSVVIRASKAGYAAAEVAKSFVPCSQCAVPVRPPAPPTPPTICKAPACCGGDTDCADTYKCVREVGANFGKCVQIIGCGLVANHALTPWECGGTGCPSCPEGSACTSHVCVKANVTQPPLVKPPIIELPPATQAAADNVLPFLLVLLLLLAALVLYVTRSKKKSEKNPKQKKMGKRAESTEP